jgi:hypothetical protein
VGRFVALSGVVGDFDLQGLEANSPGPSAVERLYTRDVATVEQPDEPRVHVYPPDEALKRARPLPRRDEFVIVDVPDDEWAAFQEALAET